MKIGIVGVGHVGTIMSELFESAYLYDEPKQIGTKESINGCDLVFVCVPTPMGKEGQCDTSLIDYSLGWIEAGTIVIRSTVPVGYTEKLVIQTGKRILFQPEYYGETVAHPFSNPFNRTWITIGGRREYYAPVIRAYEQVFTSELQFKLVDSNTAELAKYMENSFLALKVTFCNEFYDIANAMGVDYTELRETWLMDPRIGRSHTFVYPDNRGFGGACLPKDIMSIVFQCDERGVNSDLLKSVVSKNELIKLENHKRLIR